MDCLDEHSFASHRFQSELIPHLRFPVRDRDLPMWQESEQVTMLMDGLRDVRGATSCVLIRENSLEMTTVDVSVDDERGRRLRQLVLRVKNASDSNDVDVFVALRPTFRSKSPYRR